MIFANSLNTDKAKRRNTADVTGRYSLDSFIENLARSLPVVCPFSARCLPVSGPYLARFRPVIREFSLRAIISVFRRIKAKFFLNRAYWGEIPRFTGISPPRDFVQPNVTTLFVLTNYLLFTIYEN